MTLPGSFQQSSLDSTNKGLTQKAGWTGHYSPRSSAGKWGGTPRWQCEVWPGTLPSLCPFCALYLTLPHHLSQCILIMSLSDYFPQQNKRSTRINMISWESATPMLQTAELISGSFPVDPALPGLLKASTPSLFNTCVSLSGPAFNLFLFKIPIAAFTPLNCYKALT